MSKGRWQLPWFRVWTDFDEDNKWTSKATNEELGAWTRLLRLANAQMIRGEIKVENNLPYSQEQLSLLLRGGQTYLAKWAKQGAIKIINGIIFIVNWEHWQGIRNEGHPGREAKIKKQHENPPALKIKIQKQIPEQAIVQKICKKIKHNEIELNEIEKEILDCWNKIPGVIICKILTDKRRSLLKQRLEDRFFSDNWKEAMRKVFHSPFLRGQTEKGEEHGNWKPDFDWFIRPDGKKTASVVLIMEGKYDQKEKVREAD